MRRFRITCLTFITLAVSIASVGAESVAEPSIQKIDFDTQITPLLTRHGCNAGSCHGAAIGRGGFKLSLLGSDAAADHDVITRAMEGRRVNHFDVGRSLLLLKPSEQTGHEGGLVFEDDSSAFALLRTWIEQGAKRIQSRDLAILEVTPEDALIDGPGGSTGYRVTATFVDRASSKPMQVDVTDWTVITPSDVEAVLIDNEARRLTVNRPGVHVVIARFMDRVMPIRLTVPIGQLDQPGNIAVSDLTENGIDRFVDVQLKKLGLPSSPKCDDHAFLRRITLDLCGRLPSLAETERFIADDAEDKRKKKIDVLLQTREFADYWALKWANILAIDAKQLQPEGADAYHRWLADRIHEDTPIQEIAAELLTAVGDSWNVGAANFSRFGKSPGDLAEHVSQVFMGVRLRCANCHNHPLDHWTQDDYHGLSAVFAKVKKGRVVSVSDRGEVTHPVTRQPAVPRIPGLRFLEPEESGRDVFARWLSSPENPYLARVTVNRIWRELMGRGLVEPVDDLRATNPATHPYLIRWLADDFVQQSSRMKSTIASICQSAAYQRQSAPVPGNETDTQFYSHALVRPLEAEVIADAIGDVTGLPLQIAPDETLRTVSLTNNAIDSPSLDLLGRCDRSIGCDAAASSGSSLTRALHMINGPLLQSRIASPDGMLAKLLLSSDDNERILDELVRLTLSRPGASQSNVWATELRNAEIHDDESRRQFFEDVFWGILASDRFATNH